jgi:holo-[acyl-carrier protein] synthase
MKKTMKNIKGIGTDIIEVDRLKKAIDRNGEAFLKRIFTQNEIEYCNKFKDSFLHFAARFAAKEAISKALGSGLGKKLSFLDIEIKNEKDGKPIAYFSNKAKKKFSNPLVLISISHTKALATAFAILL